VIFDREAGVLATHIYISEGRELDRAEELTRAALTVSTPREKWQYELLLGRVLLADGREEEANALLLETGRRIPEEELLGQLRAAELLGDQEKITALLPRLNQEEKERWKNRRDRVMGDSGD
jgi:predicted Zn-dependent protease